MEWLAKGAGRLQQCSSAMGFLPGTPNSQAHDFSMRAPPQVQIARPAGKCPGVPSRVPAHRQRA